MKKVLTWLCLILAIAGGIFAGWVDFNNDEPQAATLVIMVVTFLTGMILPKKAWLWAIIVTLCLPGVYLIARELGYRPVSPPNPGWYASLIAIIPALIGAYLGTLARVIMNSALVKIKPQNGK
jgi:hypothetical protein